MESQGEKKRFGRLSQWFLRKQESSVILVLILYCVIVTIVNPVFISANNVVNILRSTGFTLIVVVGMTLVLITAGLDLSVGSVFAMGSIVCGICCTAGISVWLSMLIGTGVGLLFGMTIGFTIVKTGIPPLMITLGMQYIGRGMVSAITKGVPVYPLPDGFTSLEKISFFGIIPIIVPVSILIAVAGHIVLSRTTFGRSVYAIGGNQEAAKISGINIDRTKMIVYSLTSALAAFSGIMMASRLGSAEPSTGTGFEMKVICACIIGGTSSFGGTGTVLGAALGAVFMEVITNSLTLMKISVYWQNLFFGVILIAAVLLDQYKRALMMRQSVKVKE